MLRLPLVLCSWLPTAGCWTSVSRAGVFRGHVFSGERAVVVGEAGDFANVRCRRQHGGEEVLGCEAAQASPARVSEGVVGGVFDECVESFDGVASGGVERVLVGAVGERLAVFGARFGWERHRAFVAREHACGPAVRLYGQARLL